MNSVLRQRRSRDAEHVPADDLLDVVIGIAALDEADREHGPVGPGDALLALWRFLEWVGWPQGSPVGSRFGSLRHFLAFGGEVARSVRHVRANADMINAKRLHHMVNVIEQRRDVSAPAQKTWNATDADQTA